MKWMLGKLAEGFKIKTKKIGLGPEEVRETRVLNRVTRATEQGWEYEADERRSWWYVEWGWKEPRG